jgi:hypothetical protein
MLPLSQDDLKMMAEKLDGANKQTNIAPVQPSIFSIGNSGVPFAHQNVTIAEVADALRFISSDVLRGNGKIFDANGQPLPDYWQGMIWSIQSALGEAGKELARAWSMQSPRYLDGKGFEATWKDFDPAHKKPITVLSLFRLAKLNGWMGYAAPIFAQHGLNSFQHVDAPAMLFPAGNEEDRLRATPFDWPNPAQIPPRPWVFGKWLLRGTATGLIAPGGSGKSTHISAMALSLASGRDLLGKHVYNGSQRVWIFNLEDDHDELARSIQAAAQLHAIQPADCGDRLFVDSGLSGRGLCIAVEDRNGVQILKPVIEGLVAELIERRIDVMIVDPFVSSHAVNENNNSAIDAVVKQWGRVAAQASCSIVLSHHSRKLNGSEVNIDSARGASSLVNAARSVLVFNRLTLAEAQKFGIDEDERWRIFSVHDDKHNRAPAEAADWYYIESVQLANGDSVGAVRVWSPPKGSDGLSDTQLIAIQNAISAGPARHSSQSPDWAGHAVAEVLDLNPEKQRLKISSLLKAMTMRGLLQVVERKDERGTSRKFYEVGAHPSSSPPEKGGEDK